MPPENEEEKDDFLDIDELTALINEDSDVEDDVNGDRNEAEPGDAPVAQRGQNVQSGNCDDILETEEEQPLSTSAEGDVAAGASDDDLEELAALMEEDGDFDDEEPPTTEAAAVADDEEEESNKFSDTPEDAEAEIQQNKEEIEGHNESQEELMEELQAMERKMAELKKKLSGGKKALTAETKQKSAAAPTTTPVPAKSTNASKASASAILSSSKSSTSSSSSSPAPSKKPSFSGYMKGLEPEDGRRKERRVDPAVNAKSKAAETALAKKLDQVKAKLNPGASPRSATSTSTINRTPTLDSSLSSPKPPPASSQSSKKDAQMSKELFGDDFDDDDDDVDPDKGNGLNPYGAQIQNSLKKEREKVSDMRREKEVDRNVGRSVASTTSGSQSQPVPPPLPPPSKNTLAAPALRPTPSSQSSSASSSSPSSSSSSAVETESLTGIRIKNPRVSIFGLQQKLKSKRVLRLSRIRGAIRNGAIRNGAIEGEWSSLAVVVAKGEPRTSSNGNSFCVWTLSDLDDCDLKVSLFLFGETFKTHWKTTRGSVVGIVNATVMPPRDKKEHANEIALTVDQPQKLLLVGESQDLGVCRSTKKNGEKCTSFINLSRSEFCSFHVQKAYHRIGAKRGELQSAMTGHAPKKIEKAQLAKKILGGGSEFYYGGKTFTSSSLPIFGNNNNKAAEEKKRKTDLEKLASLNQLPGGSVSGFKDNIRTDLAAHHNVSSRLAAAVTSGIKGGKDFHERMTKPSAGSRTLLAHLVDKEEEERKKTTAPKSAKALLKEETASKKASHAKSASSQSASSASEAEPDVEFSFPTTSKLNSKAAAIAKVKAAGGIKKENPNAVKEARLQKLADAKSRESLKRRLSSNSGGESSGADESTTSDGSSAASPAVSASKKRKIVSMDLNSPEARRLLNAKSSHAGALAEQKAEEEESYFNALEKKEKMVEQMQQITKVKCKVVTCKQCKYTAIVASEECRQEHPHQLVFKQGSKGFFSCGKCGKRTVALGLMPDKPCKNCGEMKWNRCSMLKEKAGPTLENEVLMLRGEESGFIGAEGGANRAMKLLEQKRKGTAITSNEEDD